jgi:hypothetical protein
MTRLSKRTGIDVRSGFQTLAGFVGPGVDGAAVADQVGGGRLAEFAGGPLVEPLEPRRISRTGGN